MIKNNNRNSRDDKSKSDNRSTSRKTTGDEGSSYKGKPKAADGEDKRKRTDKPAGDAKPWEKKGSDKPFRKSEDRPFRKSEDRPFKKSSEDRPFRKSEDKPFRKFDDKKAEGDKKPYGSRKPLGEKSFGDKKPASDRKPFGDKRSAGAGSGGARSADSRPFRKREDGAARPTYKDRTKTFDFSEKPALRSRKTKEVDDGKIRLNRYIANSGICSRRKADELIEAGVVSVNGEVVSELGFKVDPMKDQVRYNGELLKREKKIYVLLNKPKDYITTTEDPQERRTVMQLVEKASRERIYPVGRLDRNTTGLLLMTNDGDLADKLSHPKNGIAKIYQVELSRSLSQGDLNKIQFGLELEDGLIKPDSISYVVGGSKKEIGIQIHSGKNRIVRRIFEHLGYEVVKLDRVVYGNLTKKDLPRGRWRYLEEHELIQIKHLIK
jgi:23S rRNA pseudouridine2605 synthase